MTTTIAPPAPRERPLPHAPLDSTDPPDDGSACHLVYDSGGVLCGATGARNCIPVSQVVGDPTASPCASGCGRRRCAVCAAQYRGG